MWIGTRSGKTQGSLYKSKCTFCLGSRELTTVKGQRETSEKIKRGRSYLPLVLGSKLYRAIKGTLKFPSPYPERLTLKKRERSLPRKRKYTFSAGSHIVSSLGKQLNEGWMNRAHQNLERRTIFHYWTVIIAKVSFWVIIDFPVMNTYWLLKKMCYGISLAVQWLRLCASNAGGADLIPGCETKIPHAA